MGVTLKLHMDAPEEGRQIWRASEKKEQTAESVYNFGLMVKDILHTERQANRPKQPRNL